MPTAVESHFNIGAVLLNLPSQPGGLANSSGGIGGRSATSNGLLLPAVLQQHLVALLQPSLGDLIGALQKLLGNGQSPVEVNGVGTDSAVLGALIALLRNHGFNIRAGLCDGSVRVGFSGPTAVFRMAGGTPASLFIRQVGLARSGA